MLELRHGHVVCINSILSLSSIPGAIDYCTSKASAYAFMESLTLGLLDCPGVDCTTILPFHTDTEMFQGMRVRYCGSTWPSGPKGNEMISVMSLSPHCAQNVLNCLWQVPSAVSSSESWNGGSQDCRCSQDQHGVRRAAVDHAHSRHPQEVSFLILFFFFLIILGGGKKKILRMNNWFSFAASCHRVLWRKSTSLQEAIRAWTRSRDGLK